MNGNSSPVKPDFESDRMCWRLPSKSVGPGSNVPICESKPPNPMEGEPEPELQPQNRNVGTRSIDVIRQTSSSNNVGTSHKSEGQNYGTPDHYLAYRSSLAQYGDHHIDNFHGSLSTVFRPVEWNYRKDTHVITVPYYNGKKVPDNGQVFNNPNLQNFD